MIRSDILLTTEIKLDKVNYFRYIHLKNCFRSWNGSHFQVYYHYTDKNVQHFPYMLSIIIIFSASAAQHGLWPPRIP
jgi:hypothetical protein